MNKQKKLNQIVLYLALILIALIMLVPFAWMVSASLKLNKDVFSYPIEWIPQNPHWQNYVDIWTKIPLATFILNTASHFFQLCGVCIFKSAILGKRSAVYQLFDDDCCSLADLYGATVHFNE